MQDRTPSLKTLMRRMGIEALYRRPRTTKAEPGHKTTRICCVGWQSRDRTKCGRWTSPTSRWRAASSIWPWRSTGQPPRVSWRLSITMEAMFCVETLEDALARYGKPDVFNTDQGSPFTGAAFTGVFASNGITISMDGKGAWRDNVFVERRGAASNIEEGYICEPAAASATPAGFSHYLDFYNSRRPHSSLGIHPVGPTSHRCPWPGSLTLAETPLIQAKIYSDDRDHLILLGIGALINSRTYQFWMRCRDVTTSLPKGSERP